MLLYNKALDANHTLLRMTALLVSWKVESLNEDALRLFDFLIANPAHIQRLVVARDRFTDKNEFKYYKNRYQNFDPKRLFGAMREIQSLAIERFVEMGILQEINSSSEYKVFIKNIPEELSSLAKSNENSISSRAVDFIVNNLVLIPVAGSDGLKKITNLMEYKYDVN